MHPTEAPKKNWLVHDSFVYELQRPKQYFPCAECELEYLCSKFKGGKLCHIFPHDEPMMFRNIGQLYHDTVSEEDIETDENLSLYMY